MVQISNNLKWMFPISPHTKISLLNKMAARAKDRFFSKKNL